MSRPHSPALVLRVESPTAALRDRLWVLLDDLRPTAVEGDIIEDVRLRVFFSSGTDRLSAQERLEAAFTGELTVEAADVPDEGWAERSQSSLRSVRVGRLVVSPPWDVGRLLGVTIVVAPSMGFGTGHHQSTRLSLAALQRLDLDGRVMMDIGTGSGVLAIAGIKLGARSATAIDTDQDAIESARRNLRLNSLEGQVALEVADVRTFHAQPAEVVTANLTGPMLTASSGHLVRLTRAGGSLIVSGLTLAEETDVAAGFASTARLVAREQEDEWVSLLFEPIDLAASR